MISFLTLINCNGKNSRPTPLTEEELAAIAAIEAEAALLASQKEKAARITAALDTRRLAAQTLICGIDSKDFLKRDMQILLEECPAGCVVLFRYNLDTTNEGIQNLIAQTAALIIAGTDGIPPFVAVDHEGGDVNRFNRGFATLPPAQSYNEMENATPHALASIEADSFRAGTEIRALGINMNLAPVAELLTDDNRAFLGTRSYGDDPAFTADAAAAFVRGMRQAGVICVVKHFPGSAGIDPHYASSTLNYDKAQLDTFISPFATLIQSDHSRALMIAHTLTPAIDPQNIASLSPVVMQNWLRGELGFDGIIVSDDFSMAAAVGSAATGGNRPEQSAVKSLAAGADMILVWPPDIRRTHRAIQAAVANGELSEDRLREAATRIIFEKITMGLIDGE